MFTPKFSATQEDFVIDKLELRRSAVGTGADGDFTGVTVSYTDSAGAAQTKTLAFVGGAADFSDLDVWVPKDGNASITILGIMQTATGGATDGDDPIPNNEASADKNPFRSRSISSEGAAALLHLGSYDISILYINNKFLNFIVNISLIFRS